MTRAKRIIVVMCALVAVGAGAQAPEVSAAKQWCASGYSSKCVSTCHWDLVSQCIQEVFSGCEYGMVGSETCTWDNACFEAPNYTGSYKLTCFNDSAP